jgi:hypothetical protein
MKRKLSVAQLSLAQEHRAQAELMGKVSCHVICIVVKKKTTYLMMVGG